MTECMAKPIQYCKVISLKKIHKLKKKKGKKKVLFHQKYLEGIVLSEISQTEKDKYST